MGHLLNCLDSFRVQTEVWTLNEENVEAWTLNAGKIDALVYQIYGLTDEEIRIVEGNKK